MRSMLGSDVLLQLDSGDTAEEILRAMGDASFDPRKEVILEQEPDPAPVPAGAQGSARIVREGTDFLELEADLINAVVSGEVGKSKREIIRCLKRYLARHVWRLLQPPLPGPRTSPPIKFLT